MKAMICTRYGPPEVLQLQEVAKPAPDSGCFVLTDYTIYPEPLREISLEEFLTMLRFEQRHKLMELGYQDLSRKRGSR